MDVRYQVFVSSTYEDLKEERAEVMQALLELDCIPAGMELFPPPARSNGAEYSGLLKSGLLPCHHWREVWQHAPRDGRIIH